MFSWICPSLGSGPTLAQGPSALAPLLFGTTFHYLCIQPPQLPPSDDVSKHTFQLGLFPRRHRCAQWPVDVTESLNNFVFEHRSGCCATESGYAGDIGAIEIWLIDWLTDLLSIEIYITCCCYVIVDNFNSFLSFIFIFLFKFFLIFHFLYFVMINLLQVQLFPGVPRCISLLWANDAGSFRSSPSSRYVW